MPSFRSPRDPTIGEALSKARPTQPVIVDGRYIGDRYPGIGRYVFSLVAAMAPQMSPRSLTLLVDPRAEQSRFDLGRLQELGVTMKQVPWGARTLRGYFAGRRAAAATLQGRHRPGSDIAVFHAPHIFSALPVHGASVVTIHDLIPLHPQHHPTARSTRLLYPRLLRRALRSATVVLAPSSAVRDQLLRRPGAQPAARKQGDPVENGFLSTISQGADTTPDVKVTPYAADESFKPVPKKQVDELRTRLGLPDSYVLCVANNRPHKNLSRLLRAWANLDDAQRKGCELVVAGGLDSAAEAAGVYGPGDQQRPFSPPHPSPVARSEQVSRAAATAVGPVDEADLPALYSGATLMVHPALMEGFGLPVAEAMASGVPVVCSDAPSLDEVCGDAALRCDATSHKSMATAVAEALADSQVRDRLAAAGLLQASSLSWQRTAELTLAAYETARELAGRPAAGS